LNAVLAKNATTASTINQLSTDKPFCERENVMFAPK
jgi:hypothetical protein